MLHFEYSDNTPFRKHRFDQVNFTVEDGLQKIDCSDFKNECINHARKIYKTNPDIYIALSGGIDSQVCFNSFIEAGLKPKILILKFSDNRNFHDVLPALMSCKKYGITPVVFEIYPQLLWEYKSKYFIDTYQVYTLFDLFIAYVAEIIKGQLLIVDKIHIRKDHDPKRRWSLLLNENDFWTNRYNSVLGEKQILNNFFLEPKILQSYLNLPVISDVIFGGGGIGKIATNSSKNLALEQAGFTNVKSYKYTDHTIGLIEMRNQLSSQFYKNTLYDNRKFYIPITNLTNSVQGEIWKFV